MSSGVLIPSGPIRVLVATRPVDFRKGMDGLAALVKEQLQADGVHPVDRTGSLVALSTEAKKFSWGEKFQA